MSLMCTIPPVLIQNRKAVVSVKFPDQEFAKDEKIEKLTVNPPIFDISTAVGSSDQSGVVSFKGGFSGNEIMLQAIPKVVTENTSIIFQVKTKSGRHVDTGWIHVRVLPEGLALADPKTMSLSEVCYLTDNLEAQSSSQVNDDQFGQAMIDLSTDVQFIKDSLMAMVEEQPQSQATDDKIDQALLTLTTDIQSIKDSLMTNPEEQDQTQAKDSCIEQVMLDISADLQSIKDSLMNTFIFLNKIMQDVEYQRKIGEDTQDALEVGQIDSQQKIDDVWEVLVNQVNAGLHSIYKFSAENLSKISRGISEVLDAQDTSLKNTKTMLQVEEAVKNYNIELCQRINDLIIESREHFKESEEHFKQSEIAIQIIKNINFKTDSSVNLQEKVLKIMEGLIIENKESIESRIKVIQGDVNLLEEIDEKLAAMPDLKDEIQAKSLDAEEALEKENGKFTSRHPKVKKFFDSFKKGITAIAIVNGLLSCIQLFTPGFPLSIGYLASLLFKVIF